MPSKSRRTNEKTMSPIKYVCFGGLSGCILYFLFIFLCSLICLKVGVDRSFYTYLGLGSGAFSGFICGFLSVRPIKQNGALYGTATGGVAALLSTVVSFILNGRETGARLFVLFALITLLGAVGGICAVNLRKKRKY